MIGDIRNTSMESSVATEDTSMGSAIVYNDIESVKDILVLLHKRRNIKFGVSNGI